MSGRFAARVSDGTSLAIESVTNNRIKLCRAKTGEPVYESMAAEFCRCLI